VGVNDVLAHAPRTLDERSKMGYNSIMLLGEWNSLMQSKSLTTAASSLQGCLWRSCCWT